MKTLSKTQDSGTVTSWVVGRGSNNSLIANFYHSILLSLLVLVRGKIWYHLQMCWQQCDFFLVHFPIYGILNPVDISRIISYIFQHKAKQFYNFIACAFWYSSHISTIMRKLTEHKLYTKCIMLVKPDTSQMLNISMWLL